MKRLRVILLFLLLGAVVNVAVAWGLAFANYPGVLKESGMDLDDGKVWPPKTGITRLVYIYTAWGTSRCETRITSIWFLVGGPYWPGKFPEQSVREVLPHWALFADPSATNEKLFDRRTVNGFGWPWIAMWSGYELDSAGQLIEVRAGYLPHYVLPTRQMKNTDLRIYPFGIIWGGLFLNTMIYAAALWFLLNGPFVLRRFIRRQHSLCENCAYDIRGTNHATCPECGVALTA